MTSGFTITIAIDPPAGDAPEALAAAQARIAELERQLEDHYRAEHRSTSHRQTVLIEGLLAAVERGAHPLEHPLDVPPGLAGRVAKALAPAHEAENLRRELQGMQHRERQVDAVVAAWDVERGGLNGYDKVGALDPETPAGRVVELLRDLTKVRPHTTLGIKADRAALDAIYAELGEYGLLRGNDGDYDEAIVTATRDALTDRAVARQQLEAIERTIASIPAGDPAEGRTVADRVYAAFTALTGQSWEDTGAAAAMRIRAYLYDTSNAATHDSANDALDLESFLAGLARAAQIAADETPEADPNVAHIDTVNGRQRPAQAPDTTESE